MTRLLTSLLILLALTLPATAKRVALVIGNDSYSNQIAEAQLKKAVNDATAVRDTLMKLGFDVVFRTNASQRDFKNAVLEFSRKIKKDDVAMFFFAGHGAALKGTNYFLPSDIPKLELPDTPSEQDIETKVAELAEFSVRESFVLEQISKNEPKVSLLIMDACRDNPLRDDSGDNPFRSTSKSGIVLGDNISTAEKAQPEGMIIVYSASFGQRALDRLSETETEPNSPFTRSFLKNLNQPGMGLKQVVAATKEEVFKLAKSIDKTQTPAVYDQLFGGDVFLSGETRIPSPKANVADRNSAAKMAFDAAASDLNMLRTVATEFADTSWGKLAAGKLETENERKIAVLKLKEDSLADTGMDALKAAGDDLETLKIVAKKYEGTLWGKVALERIQKKEAKIRAKNHFTNRVGTFNFPHEGLIAKWEIFFKFQTRCERDHFASLTSPMDRRLIVMNRGNKRCSGKRETFTSSNDDEVGAFMGSQAKGDWRFEMVDLDDNEFEGKLDQFWMQLTINNKGKITKHKVSLSGLPKAIPLKQ